MRLRRENKEVETDAIANAGFKTPIDKDGNPVPIILVSDDIWKKLGSPKQHDFIVSLSGLLMQSTPFFCYDVEVSVVADDRDVRWVRCYMAVQPKRKESLMNTYLIHLLKIQLIDVYEGLWRFSDDPPNKIRRSV